MEKVSFEQRFQGFTDGALGGYVAGVVARGIEGPAEVSLRSLPPMERELDLSRGNGKIDLHDGETLIAEAHEAGFELELPDSPELAGAEAAGEHPIHEEGTHIYPGCFCCGPDRAEGDGLRLFVGRVAESDGLLAAAWTPHPDLAEGDELPEEMVWAALDCPTIWAAWSTETPAAIPSDTFTVLARQRLESLAPIPLGRPAIVTSWPISRDGRKYVCGAAIHGSDGRLLTRAESLLVEVPRKNLLAG